MALLLLPEVDDPATAYAKTLESALSTCLSADRDRETSPARLDIAIVLAESLSSPRGAGFTRFQILLKHFYEAVLAAGKDFRLDLVGGVDARVFFLETTPANTPDGTTGNQPFCGPVVDQHTFVSSGRVYNTVFVPHNEPGLEAAQDLLNIVRSKGQYPAWNIKTLPSDPSLISTTVEAPSPSRSPSQDHYSVAVGGTFDHLHIGHKLLLTATIFAADPLSPTSTNLRLITVGITDEALLVNKKHASVLESWPERQKRTANFVESILVFHPATKSTRTETVIEEPGPNGHVVRVSYGHSPSNPSITINYTKISDPFGPTITDENISAIVISKETRAGGKAVNDKRVEKGWKPLEVFEVDILNPSGTSEDDEKFAKKISSTEIRRVLAQQNS